MVTWRSCRYSREACERPFRSSGEIRSVCVLDCDIEADDLRRHDVLSKMRIESGGNKKILHRLRDESRRGLAGYNRADTPAELLRSAGATSNGHRKTARYGERSSVKHHRRRHRGFEVLQLHLLGPISRRLAFRVLD